MNTKLLIALLCILITHAVRAASDATAPAAAPAAAPAGELEYFGSKITDLDPIIAKQPKHVLFIFLKDGQGPNINIQTQPAAGSMKEFIDLSYKQFDELFGPKQWSIPFENRKIDKEYTVEIVGTIPDGPAKGRKIHFYTRVFRTDTKFYLIVATVPDADWPEVGAKVKRYVDSFQQ